MEVYSNIYKYFNDEKSETLQYRRAKLKLKGINGRAPLGVEPVA